MTPPSRSTGRLVVFAAGVVAALSSLTSPALGQSGAVSWGGLAGAPPPPPGLTYVDVAAGPFHELALRSDGWIVAWGWNANGQCIVPSLPNGLTYVDVDGGTGHSVAVRSDGSIVAWGSNFDGQCNVPPLPTGLTYVEASAGNNHTIARRSDGSVVAWGKNNHGQCDVPPLPSGLLYVQVAAGGHVFDISAHNVALRSDGSVVAWGEFFTYVPPLPIGLTYTKVTAGESHSIAIRSDGSAIWWGDCFYVPMCTVPPLPSGLTYVDIAAGYNHDVAVRSDGSMVAWGDNYYGACNVPPLPVGLSYVKVAAGDGHSVALYEGCPTCEPPFCLGDGEVGSVACPCGNNGSSGRGCDNSATRGARLVVHGSVEPDRVALGATDVIPSALCIFFQARALLASPVAFGDGVRCIGGSLERIGVKTASAGSARYPGVGYPSISAQSAALGDPIRPGTYRYYQVYYRDPDPGFCNPAPATFNATNAVMVKW